MAEGPRGRTRWGVLAAVLALPGLAVAGCIVLVVFWLLTDDASLGGGPEQVPCADALRFGGAELPDGAEVVGACEEQGFQDVRYSADFRMPRADVPGWLRDTYPQAPAPATAYCDGDADLCLDVDHPGDGPGVGAQAVQVNVEYEAAGTALVHFSAFTF